MDIKLIRLNLENVKELEEIEKICFSDPWSLESLTQEMINPQAYYIGAFIQSKLIGYMGLWKIIDEGHVMNIAVLPDYRKLGIASIMVEDIISICLSNDIKRLTLEVRASNEEAINLYEKYEFKELGRRLNYYQNPKEDAMIMWKELDMTVV